MRRCEARGVPFERPLWSDPAVDWSAYDLAVVRTVWDYTAHRDAFVDWAARVADLTTIENSADVLRWNTHKGYLLELEERGAPVVPTAWLGQGDAVDLADLCAARGWDEVVVKPAVAAGSDGLVRAAGVAAAHRRAQDAVDALLAAGDVMVQPFRRRIVEGELSLVAVEGRVTHAVRKRPADGEFRVQGRFGGRYAPEEPSRRRWGSRSGSSKRSGRRCCSPASTSSRRTTGRSSSARSRRPSRTSTSSTPSRAP
jgi:glutathione synthase/RimK-type ligase-like ATP-grasp enzyme